MSVPAEYRLILTTDTGSRLDNPFNPIGAGFWASRKANTISPCMIELPHYSHRKIFDMTVANPAEYMIQVWRKADGGTMKLFNTYIVTEFEQHADPTPNGKRVLKGWDMNLLLYRRIVAAYAASANARITDYADDMIKGLMTDAQSDVIAPVPTAGTRAWANLTVAGDVSKGPSITLDLEYQKLLTFAGGGAFKKITNASQEAGTDLFFEVQPNLVLENSINFILNTFTTQIGQDLTDSITLSRENSTIENAVSRYSYGKAMNYIYAGGKGQDDARTISQAYDATEYGRGIWARSEGFKDVPSVDDASLQNEADAFLQDSKRLVEFKGNIVDTAQIRYGRDYDFGDLVTAKAWGDQFDAMISAVTVGMRDGRDIVDVKADYRL